MQSKCPISIKHDYIVRQTENLAFKELELYMDLAMNDRNEATTVKLFPYFYILAAVKGGKSMIRWPSKFSRWKELYRRC